MAETRTEKPTGVLMRLIEAINADAGRRINEAAAMERDDRGLPAGAMLDLDRGLWVIPEPEPEP